MPIDDFDSIKNRYESLHARYAYISGMKKETDEMTENATLPVEAEIRRVSCRLPRRNSESLMAGITRAEKGESSYKGKVLVMDDEEIIRTILCVMLLAFGYETHLSSEGDEAIARYAEAKEAGSPFDAVIVDLNVTDGLGGKETIGKLLEIDPAVKAIVSSGNHGDPVITNFIEHGFMGVLRKPYTINELRQVLNRVISGKNNRGMRTAPELVSGQGRP